MTVISIPSDGNYPSLEYSISAFGNENHTVRTNREKRLMAHINGATHDKGLDSSLVISVLPEGAAVRRLL